MKKKLFLFASWCLACLVGVAQELTVTYRVTFNTHSPDLFAENGLTEELRSGLANAYRHVVLTYRLTYINGESEFRLIPAAEKQTITFMGQTMELNAAMKQQAGNVTYKNHAKGILIDKISLFGKDFLVTDSLRGHKFVVKAGETKTIMGFECQRALSTDGKQTVWFTPHIPISNEPVVSGLPGLILEYDSGQQIYTVTHIEEAKGQTVSMPTGGKEMTKASFDKMVKQRVDAMKRGG
jgi:GLPGLI family protein